MVDAINVKFDPVEIEEIYYFSMDELQNMVNQDRVTFCDWFAELLNWHAGRPSKMKLMNGEF